MPPVMVTPPALVNLATTSSMEKQRLAHVSIGHVTMRNLPMVQTILTELPLVFSASGTGSCLQQTDTVRPERLCVCPDVAADTAVVVCHSEQCHDILCEDEWCAGRAV